MFCLKGAADNLELIKWIAIVILFPVITGIFPAVTALPHWYVTWSFMSSSTTADGGEHISANLTLIFLPLLMSDRRMWHWHQDSSYYKINIWIKNIRYNALILFILQMMGLYFQASIAKFGVFEWTDGTVLWYWTQNPTFSPPESFSYFLLFISIVTDSCSRNRWNVNFSAYSCSFPFLFQLRDDCFFRWQFCFTVR